MNTNKELNLLNHKIVYDITKFTTTDYYDHLSCVVWLSGCNMRCLYCYNDNIVNSKSGKYTYNDVLTFLKKRVGLLDGVVLSGGEALMHDLSPFCKEIKNLGFKIKLDTNGINYKGLKKLLEEDLIDYIALDYKAPYYKYEQITKTNRYFDFLKSLKYLIEKKFNFEVRSTIHGDLLDINDINQMVNMLYFLGYRNTYYLQNFLETPSNIGDIEASTKELNFSQIETNKLNIEIRN